MQSECIGSSTCTRAGINMPYVYVKGMWSANPRLKNKIRTTIVKHRRTAASDDVAAAENGVNIDSECLFRLSEIWFYAVPSAQLNLASHS